MAAATQMFGGNMKVLVLEVASCKNAGYDLSTFHPCGELITQTWIGIKIATLWNLTSYMKEVGNLPTKTEINGISCAWLMESRRKRVMLRAVPKRVFFLMAVALDRDRKLRIFTDGEHPFGDRALEPYVMPPRKVREMRPRARRALIRAQKKTAQKSTSANPAGSSHKDDASA
ncbi:hypothetical protein KSP40_PGU017717 [Platanthera guangdongensis]|uniref:Uncharacterized protein n=1 Tax=Platanthera guangdongensis TaxID=2320717 RepID=A0ABR2M5G3_9ASPA